MEGIFKDFEFFGGMGYGGIFRCSFQIGLNPYEMQEHRQEVLEFLAGFCQKFSMLEGNISAVKDQHEFATREELETEGYSIWSYTAICND